MLQLCKAACQSNYPLHLEEDVTLGVGNRGGLGVYSSRTDRGFLGEEEKCLLLGRLPPNLEVAQRAYARVIM